MNKKVDELTAEDFPGVDPGKFQEWKDLHKRATRAPIFGILIWGTALITVPMIGGGIGWGLPILFWFTYMFAYSIPLAKRERNLAASIGVDAQLQRAPSRVPQFFQRPAAKRLLWIWLALVVVSIVILAVKASTSLPKSTSAAPTSGSATVTVLKVENDSAPTLGAVVDPSFFASLGAAPAAGRFFLPTEFGTTAYPVAILSYDFWNTRFRGQLSILGQDVGFEEKKRTIVGIAPKGFNKPNGAQFWIPAEVPIH